MRRRQFATLGVSGTALLAFLHRTRAQPPRKLPRIGWLSPGYSTGIAEESFHQGVKEFGYTDGQNVIVDYRFGEGHYGRLAGLVAELIQLRPDVLVTVGTTATTVIKDATDKIPVVALLGDSVGEGFVASLARPGGNITGVSMMAGAGGLTGKRTERDDPVAAGLVASLARPGGNLTGFSIFAPELNPKRLQLLSEVVPHVDEFALLVNPTGSSSELIIPAVEEAARASGRRLSVLRANTEDEINTALATVIQLHAGGLVVATDPFFNSRREQIIALAARHAVPAIYQWREFVDGGGLISYGPSITDGFRRVGATLAGFSREPILPTCRSSDRRGSSW
jgi:ABC-type uncharacterized transport system substrate-binding protein